MCQKLLVLICFTSLLSISQMTDDMVRYVFDYDELNTTLLNKDCVIFLASDNCTVCQGIDLQWLARYLYRVGRSLVMIHVNTNANSNLTNFFVSKPPAILAVKDGFFKEYGDDIYLISVVEWLESIFPVVHEGPTKVWFSDESISELQKDDVAGKKLTMVVIWFSHTTIANAKLFVHYRQTAELFKGRLKFYFVDLGSAGGKTQAKFLAGRTRVAPQVLYISSEGRATGPLNKLPINTYLISLWIDENYRRDMHVTSRWRKGSGLIKKLTNLAQLRVKGHTVILVVMGRTQVSMQAYHFLFEGATYLQSEMIHFWLLDLSVRRDMLTRALDVGQYSVPFYMSLDSDGNKKVLPHSSSKILIQWLINITTYVEKKNTGGPLAKEYQVGVVNSYNEKISLEQLSRGIGFGLLLYTDDCPWCKPIRKLWGYLAKQCQQVIFTEAKPSDIIYGELSGLLIQGNGIFYVNRKQPDIVASRFDFDKTLKLIQTFVTRKGDWKYMHMFMTNYTYIPANEEHWPENLHCYNSSHNEATTLKINSDIWTTMSPFRSPWTSHETLNDNKSSLGNQHLSSCALLATISVTMATMCHYT